MLVSTNLDQITAQAITAVYSHPQHDLNLGYRQAIWAAYGSANNYGHKKRAILAILTAKSVLPIWNNVWHDDSTPHQILNTAEQVLNGTLNNQIARNYRDEVWTIFENKASEQEFQSLEYQKPINAGLAAIAALNTALYDEEFDPDNIDYNLTDADMDAYETDSSFWAAAAYANGPIWEPMSNANKRLEFWDWWLTTAVPKALQ